MSLCSSKPQDDKYIRQIKVTFTHTISSVNRSGIIFLTTRNNFQPSILVLSTLISKFQEAASYFSSYKVTNILHNPMKSYNSRNDLMVLTSTAGLASSQNSKTQVHSQTLPQNVKMGMTGRHPTLTSGPTTLAHIKCTCIRTHTHDLLGYIRTMKNTCCDPRTVTR